MARQPRDRQAGSSFYRKTVGKLKFGRVVDVALLL